MKLERGLIRVRWFGIAFAFFQIFMGTDPACPSRALSFRPDLCEPFYLRPVGYFLAAGLLVLNVAAWGILRRRMSAGRSVSNLGVAMFLADHAFLIAYTYLYSGVENTTTWVMLYILPLEGALRYGMSGALISLGMLTAGEVGRDFFRRSIWGYPFTLVPGTSFRIGIMTIIGLVAGMMSRSLQEQRDEVERRAELLEALVVKEEAARNEIQAFQNAIIAGVSQGSFQEATGAMIQSICETLGFESLSLGLLEEDGEDPRIRIVAGHHFPPEHIGTTISLDQGICGPVVETGKAALVDRVEDHDNYLKVMPGTKSEMAVPLKLGDKVFGVLNVESSKEAAFTDKDLEQLGRLASHAAVVVENARALDKEQEAVKRLTELDTMKTDFIAITSHELRTPLTVIRGFIQTLRRKDVTFQQHEIENYLEVIERQSNRLNAIVEDLLFVSRIESGQVDLQQSSFDVNDLVEELVAAEFVPNRVTIDSPHRIRVISDYARMRRIISNLLDNALKFSPENSIVAVDLVEHGSEVKVIVKDQGSGIAADELDRIFDRFHQIGGALGREQQGVGLGLYVVKRVAEAMGGRIEVQSTPGIGSSFTLVLPKGVKSESTDLTSQTEALGLE